MHSKLLTLAAAAALTFTASCSSAAASVDAPGRSGQAPELVARLSRFGCEPAQVRRPEIPDMAGCVIQDSAGGEPAVVVVVTRAQVTAWDDSGTRAAAERTGLKFARGSGWLMFATGDAPDMAEMAEALDS